MTDLFTSPGFWTIMGVLLTSVSGAVGFMLRRVIVRKDNIAEKFDEELKLSRQEADRMSRDLVNMSIKAAIAEKVLTICEEEQGRLRDLLAGKGSA